MNNLAILTPSYLPDLKSFIRLHQSVLANTNSNIKHHVIVPKRDQASFRTIDSPRLKVWCVRDFLPDGFIETDYLAALGRRFQFLPQSINCSALNLRRPWPPIRGWILQQLLKLSAAAQMDSQAVVIIDSDVVLVRHMPAASFVRETAVRLYEKPGAITGQLPRHVAWTKTAYGLLDIPWHGEASYPDYIGAMISWDPSLVRQCLERVEKVSGKGWAQAISGTLHFSECILYGTYLRHFGNENQLSFVEDSTGCHSHWSPNPLVGTEAQAFVAAYDPNDFAVHIQSNSHTPAPAIESVLADLAGRPGQ